MPDLFCFDITLGCPQSRSCVVLIELLQIVKDLNCVLVCVDLAYEAVVIDSISIKIIVSSFFKTSFKYKFVRSLQSRYFSQKMLSLQHNNNNNII